uniref:NADH dehydrogenase subunit 4 n=1 Tax=China mantispoides TaxID=3034372 RepID=UPI0024111F6B|nr:NADH dehydrogenase subunit 4 [China mantispoides]WEL32767.1 NADH dehydrogenase subunit 4 [China mantispoides]
MLKFMLMILFMTPLCLLYNSWWVVHSFMFLMSFLFMFMFCFSVDYGHLSYIFGVDFFSCSFIFLSMWICSLMISASSSVYFTKNYFNLFLFISLILMLMLYLSFSSLSLFSFYLFFESSLIPTLLLILGWGYQPERMQSGVYLIFYTLFASMPLLIVLFSIYLSLGTLYYLMLMNFSNFYFFFYLFLILAFLVKMPMFIFHLWLPKAHVEAPVSGSMILAGVLLKLGGYGIIRVVKIMMYIGMCYNYFIICLCLYGGLVVSLLCLRQIDLKSLIAYSSVSHMSLVIGGLMTMSYWGIMGSLLLMIGHGLCSSGLFSLANIVYERSGSRLILLNSGMINYMPSMCLWWFLMISSNMSFPPSLNLFGEIVLFNSIMSWSFYLMFLLMFLSFFSASYSLYMYSYSQHGKFYSGIYSFSSGYFREYYLIFLHWLPLNMLFISGDLFYF